MKLVGELQEFKAAIPLMKKEMIARLLKDPLVESCTMTPTKVALFPACFG